MMSAVAYNFGYLAHVMVIEPSPVVVEIQKQIQHTLDVTWQHQNQSLVPDQQKRACA